MGVWKDYESRLGVTGGTERTSALNHAQDQMRRKMMSSLSYKTAVVDGTEQNVAIIDERDFNAKKIYSMPGDDLPHGGLVNWADSMWLITEINAHKEVYTEAKMLQCNHILKWINDDGNIIERWCVVEDGTKYLIGEKEEKMMTIGDARIAVTVGKDADTAKLNRGKRFLIDDSDSNSVLAYQITKPNKLFNVYNGRGVFRFILNEVNLTDNDNVELRIADYYNWKPKKDRMLSDIKTDDTLEEIVSDSRKEDAEANDIDKKGWL